MFKCQVFDYECLTARGMRVHLSRWCLVDESTSTSTSTSTATATSTSTTGGATDGGTSIATGTTSPDPKNKRRRIDDDEDDEEEEKADTDSIAVELLSPVPPELFTPPAIRRDNLVSIPFPERMNGVSEATYAMQTKYLAMSREILEKVNAVSLDQTARNELFLMKFCLDNGLGRDPGQQLLNWMKSVCNMHIYMNICVIFT